MSVLASLIHLPAATDPVLQPPVGPFTSLEELRRAHARMLAALNHEIRTPLTGVLGMADLLLETSLTAEQRDYVQSTRTCAETLLESLSNALEFAAVTGGDLRLSDAPFRLHEVVRAAVAGLQSRAEARGLYLNLLFETGENSLEVVTGDAIRLRQVIGILLSHAIRTCLRDEVAIAVSTYMSPSAQRLTLTVSVGDNGPDLPPERLRALFDAPGFGAYNQANLELGLPLAFQLVRAMGGSLAAESVSGCGTILTITLPLGAHQEAAAEPPRPHTGAASGAPRILLVEDNDVAQRFMRTVLERKGYHVQVAVCGPDAIQAVDREPFDMILMDVQMPEMDGFETTRAIRRLLNGQTVPVVACTANTAADVRAACQQAGMDDFLSKPVQTSELAEMAGRYVAKRSL